MMSDDDNGGQMIFGDFGGLKLPDICLTGEGKPRKKPSPRKPVPTTDRTRARCVTGAHATAWSTAVAWEGGSQKLSTRTLDNITRAGLHESAVNRMPGKPPETTQDNRDK